MGKRASGNESTAAAPTPSAGGASGNGRIRAADQPVLTVKTDGKGRIFSHIRQKWLIETPEERVRQAYVVILHNEYGFDLAQMDGA